MYKNIRYAAIMTHSSEDPDKRDRPPPARFFSKLQSVTCSRSAGSFLNMIGEKSGLQDHDIRLDAFIVSACFPRAQQGAIL